MPRIKKCSPDKPNMAIPYLSDGVKSTNAPTPERRIGLLLMLFSALSLSACTRGCSGGGAAKQTNVYQKVTGEDVDDDRDRWDRLFNTVQYVYGKEPAQFLAESLPLLPKMGTALDIAMGEGRNAVFLARQGLEVEGVDISDVAIRKAKLLAREHNVTIQTVSADLNEYQIKPNSYDVILNFYYLQRNLLPQIRRGLKKGGVVVFENHTVDQLKNPGGQGLRRDYLLEKGELKRAFEGFKILAHREVNDGKEAVESLVAQKP